MTAGQDALREAARLEAAAFYSRPAGDTSIASRQRDRLEDERVVVDALNRAEIARAIRAGTTVDGLMWQFAMSRPEAVVALRDAS